METNFIRLRLRSNLLLFIMLLFSWNTFAQSDTLIPDKYSDLYRKLEFTLDEQLKTENVKFAVNQTHKPLLMCTDLLVANSNRGEILLKPETLAGVKFSLNSFSKLGIGCVKFAVQYPLLTEDFPRNKEYLEFYKQVISEAHKLGIKVMPHVSVIFANTPFSPLKGIYKGLTLEKFKTDYRKMVMLIAQELKPDYLDLLTEPDTHAKLTGLTELNRPEIIADVIQNALRGWDHKGILCGAGSGSWSSTEYAKALAAIPELDYIAIHIYPISDKFLDNARQMIRIAHANKKQACIDEAWLYKTDRPGVGQSGSESAEIMRRDAYSFWEPLDRKFMTLIYQLAVDEHVSLLSFFWSSFFYGNLQYTPEMENISYKDFMHLLNQRSYGAIRNSNPTKLGEYLNTLAKQ